MTLRRRFCSFVGATVQNLDVFVFELCIEAPFSFCCTALKDNLVTTESLNSKKATFGV